MAFYWNTFYRSIQIPGIVGFMLLAGSHAIIAKEKPNNLTFEDTARETGTFDLTPVEKQWLRQNKNYLFHTINMKQLSEISFNGESSGFLVDYLHLINQKLNSNFQLAILEQEEMKIEFANNSKISILGKTKDKISRNLFNFTQTILKIPNAFYSRKDEEKIIEIENLNGRKLGVFDPLPNMAHTTNFDYIKQYSKIDLFSYKTMLDQVKALESGEIDFIYGNQFSIQKNINENLIIGVVVNKVDVNQSIKISIAVDKKEPVLLSVLNKAISNISKQDKAILYNKWLASSESAKQIFNFSKAELNWINNHPTVLYSDVSWMPYISVDDGNVKGIAKDYLDLVSKETGINFQFVPSENWQTLIKELKDGNITLSLAAGKTEQREKFADFSEPFITSPMGIITSKRFSYVEDLKQLEGLTVAIPRNLFFTDMLVKDYPKINLVYTDTFAQAFTLVAKEKADAYVGNLAVAAFYLRKSELANLQIAGTVDHQFAIHFMIRKSNPELISIFNKVLARVSNTQRREINNRWFSISFQSGVDPKIIWQIVITAVLILFVVLYWVGRLKKEIDLRKLTELSLKSARVDAERANHAKSEFLANMSHEIRTPMNAVIGFTQLLLETKLTEKQQTYLDSIKVGGTGLLHIINDVLDLSKIEAGKLSIEYASVDLHKLLEEIDQTFERSMKDKGLSFSINIANDVPKYLVLDENRVRQVLLNLIGNAQKFTEQGSVEVTVSRKNESTEMVKIQLTVQIKDTGIGIEIESMDRIFRNFEQHKKFNTQKYGGTGLGLAISRKLAEKMNGRLTATSNIDKGSTFTLQLNDVAIASSVSKRATTCQDYQFEAAVIMVVDDVDTNRMVVCKYLEPYPFELIEARNGVEAVSLALKVKPDLILMDLRMPEMDGYQATINIKKKLDIPVIALTASALEDKASKQEKLIFNSYLRKPVLKTKLIETIGKYLGHNIAANQLEPPPVEFIIPAKNHQNFSDIVANRLLQELETVSSIGQFDRIEHFAEELKALSERFEIDALRITAKQLSSATGEFDIEKIDLLLSRLRQNFKEITRAKT